MFYTVYAPAKVNLHLAVGPKRSDGFHALRSLFVRLALADALNITVLDAPFSISITGLEMYCEPGEDTLSKIAMRWYERTGKEVALRVAVTKEIPVQSGLGGGSSDAAALLGVLNQIAPLSEGERHEIALEVGSDIPFFLADTPAAIVEGRGEVVTPIAARNLPILLVMPKDFTVSTGQAFAKLASIRDISDDFSPETEEIVRNYNNSCATWCNVLYNDFCTVVEEKGYLQQLDALVADEPGFSSLTGSGSCWFYISEELSSVERVKERVLDHYGGSVHWWLSTTDG